MVGDLDELERLLPEIKRARIRVNVVFIERLAGAALEPILQRLDSVNAKLISLDLSEPLQVRRFLCSEHIDPLHSELTTRQLAVGAYRLSAGPTMDDSHVIGLAVSAINDGRGHLVLHSERATHQCTFELSSDSSQDVRLAELRSLIVEGLAREVRLLASDESFYTTEAGDWLAKEAEPPWQQLVAGETLVSGNAPSQPVLLPGSFHPIHHGHQQMMAIASARLGAQVHLEITVVNADKPALDYLTINDRVRQATSIGPVLLTNAPRFVDKARLFPGATFLIGADTAIRLDDARFYEENERKRDQALQTIAEHGCRFLVFGRLVDETFHDASQLPLTPTLRGLCQFVPTTEFRIDISSRELRRSGDQQS